LRNGDNMKKKKKGTVYLDWIPVKVTYTEVVVPVVKIQYCDGLVTISIG